MSDGLRIVHVITGLGTGGAERALSRVVTRLEGRHHALIVSLTEKGRFGAELATKGVAVESLGLRRGSVPWSAPRRLHRLLRRWSPDAVLGWMYHGNLAAWAGLRLGLRRLPGKPSLLWTIRHTPGDVGEMKRLSRWVLSAGARLSPGIDGVLYNSETSARRHRELGYRPRREIVIPNGFDTDRFRPDAGYRSGLRHELGCAEDDVLIGLYGRYHPLKDHRSFLTAAAALLARRPQARFVLAGTGVDSDNQELRAAIHRGNLAGRVHLLGERRDMPRLNAGLDIATCCSLGESFPNVVGEAMASGVPCAVTEVGDAATLVGDTGRVTAPGEPSALASAWESLLDLGSDGRRELGDAARRRIVARYGLAEVADRYDRWIRSVREEAS